MNLLFQWVGSLGILIIINIIIVRLKPAWFTHYTALDDISLLDSSANTTLDDDEHILYDKEYPQHSAAESQFISDNEQTNGASMQ